MSEEVSLFFFSGRYLRKGLAILSKIRYISASCAPGKEIERQFAEKKL